MTRQLATIQRIKAINPIAGADNIEAIQVLDWQVVSQKGHKVGDLVVFYEIDSFLPASDARYDSFKERFITWNGIEGMRLKSIKLRKTLSQGLIMSMAQFPEILGKQEGDDVTAALNIQKWEAAEESTFSGTRTQGSGKAFPSFIQKTNQTRVQNIARMVEAKLGDKFEVSMKKDGSSMTVFKVMPDSPYYTVAKELVARKGKKVSTNLIKRYYEAVKSFLSGLFVTKPAYEPIIGVCSRNLMLTVDGESTFHQAVKKFDLYNKINGSFALQGELLAPSIQGNYEKVSDVEFQVFDIFNIDEQSYFDPEARQQYCDTFDIPHVTVLANVPLLEFIANSKGETLTEKLLDKAEGDGDNPGVKREGLVFKHHDSAFSFKAISNSYLLIKG